MEPTDEERGFVAACGAKLPLRLSIRNEFSGEAEDILIERPWTLVGGDKVCDVRLLHPDVSQRHAYLQFVGARLLCCDLGSRTGTHWSADIRPRGWLKTGEPIYLGPFSIRVADNDFILDGTPAPAPSRASGPHLELPRVALSFANARSRAGRSRISRITRPVTLVGWSHLCNLRLQHSSVGRVHCSLVWTPDGLWVVDLLCRGGTRVNGKLVSLAHLNEGDEITAGRFQLRVSYAAASQAEAVPELDGGSQPERSLESHSAAGVSVAVPHVLADSFSTAPPSRSAAESNASHSTPGISAVTGVLAPVEGNPGLFGGPPPGLMSFTPMPLTLPEGHSLSDAVALSLMQQFSIMQQQLFGHTQQLLAVMAQTFSAAHTRQLDLIRDELFRVHEVNRELQELNLKLTAAQQSPAPGGTYPAPAPPAAPSLSAAANEPAPAATKETIPEQPTLPVDQGAGPEPAVAPAAAIPRRGKKGPKATRGHQDEVAPAAQPAADKQKPGPDMHAWLCGRINELEQERTTRWRKILQILAPSGGAG